MNWYKLAKRYQEIAHPTEDGQLYQLWVINNGRVSKSPIYDSSEVRTNHNMEFRGEINRDTCSGRYDPRTKELSIAGSYRSAELCPPEDIVNKVIASFPEARKAYLYNVYGDEVKSINL